MNPNGTIQVSRQVLNDVIEALSQCAEYLEPKQDADGDSEGFHPNEEMQLYTLCEAALEALPSVPTRVEELRAQPIASAPYPHTIDDVLALKR